VQDEQAYITDQHDSRAETSPGALPASSPGGGGAHVLRDTPCDTTTQQATPDQPEQTRGRHNLRASLGETFKQAEQGRLLQGRSLHASMDVEAPAHLWRVEFGPQFAELLVSQHVVLEEQVLVLRVLLRILLHPRTRHSVGAHRRSDVALSAKVTFGDSEQHRAVFWNRVP
jgi:hypothetical protein